MPRYNEPTVKAIAGFGRVEDLEKSVRAVLVVSQQIGLIQTWMRRSLRRIVHASALSG